MDESVSGTEIDASSTFFEDDNSRSASSCPAAIELRTLLTDSMTRLQGSATVRFRAASGPARPRNICGVAVLESTSEFIDGLLTTLLSLLSADFFESSCTVSASVLFLMASASSARKRAASLENDPIILISINSGFASRIVRTYRSAEVSLQRMVGFKLE